MKNGKITDKILEVETADRECRQGEWQAASSRTGRSDGYVGYLHLLVSLLRQEDLTQELPVQEVRAEFRIAYFSAVADRCEQWASFANIMLLIATDCSIMIIKQQYDDIRQQFCGILFGYESSLCSYSPHEKRIKKVQVLFCTNLPRNASSPDRRPFLSDCLSATCN